MTSGEFVESTAENWESEFFQMAAFVLLSAFLFQRGSAESKDPDEKSSASRRPRVAAHRGVSCDGPSTASRATRDQRPVDSGSCDRAPKGMPPVTSSAVTRPFDHSVRSVMVR